MALDSPSPRTPFAFRFGPIVGDGGTTFQLWAPGARKLELVVDPDGPRPRRLAMPSAGHGFYSLFVEDAGPGTRYRFSRNGGQPLPDPASRWQPDGAAGASEVLAPRAAPPTSWPGRPVDEWVLYEVHVGAYTEAGTYGGLEEKLDHLGSIGVNALELMPLATFAGQRNWGYDGVMHFAPHPAYGTPAELQRLIDACHDRGIAVILDVVTNHFGPECNAMWTLAPTFFDAKQPTSWGPGIAWQSEPVLSYFDELVRYLLERYDVDGFRFDAFHAIPPAARPVHLRRMIDAVATAQADRKPRPTMMLLESHANQSGLLGEHPPAIQVAQLNFDYQRATHAHLTGESHGEYHDFATSPIAEIGRCAEAGFAFRQRHSEYFGKVLGDPGLPPSWDGVINFIQNHDTAGNRYLGERLDQLTRPAWVRAATAMLLLHPGVPFLFMGQEWGAKTPFLFFVDHSSALNERVARARMAGFRELSPEAMRRQKPPARPGDPEALDLSRLSWDDHDQGRCRTQMKFVRQLLSVRSRVIRVMTRDVASTRTELVGPALAVKIPARDQSPGFVLFCNLSGEVAEIPKHTGLIYTSSFPCGGCRVPAWTVQLRRSFS